MTFAIALGLASCQTPVPPSALTADVERVVSGQTLEVRLKGEPQALQVRLWGIEAPDHQQQPWSKAAYQFLVEQVANEPVVVEFIQSSPDRYGRFLARVWVQRQFLNEMMVAQGQALVATHRSGVPTSSRNTQYDQRLVWAQQRAKILGLGIWNPRSPLRQSATEFRKQPSFLPL